MIRRIGKVLSLQAQAVSSLVNAALFSGDRAIQKIAGIQLQSRLVSHYAQYPSRCGFIHFRGLGELPGCMIQNKIVIVAVTEL